MVMKNYEIFTIIVLASLCPRFTVGKTVNGVLSSKEAQFNKGQYISSFCFYGMFRSFILRKRLFIFLGDTLIVNTYK